MVVNALCHFNLLGYFLGCPKNDTGTTVSFGGASTGCVEFAAADEKGPYDTSAQFIVDGSREARK